MSDKEVLLKILLRWPFYQAKEWLKCYDDTLTCPCVLANVCEYELNVLVNIYADIFGESKITSCIKVRDIRAAKSDLLEICEQMEQEVNNYASDILSQFDIP